MTGKALSPAGPPGCPSRVFFVADRRRGREGCGEHVGDRPVRPSVRPNCLFPRSLPRSRRVGATHFPKEHSTLWPRLHTVLMVSTSVGELHNIHWKELCNATCHWLRDPAPRLTLGSSFNTAREFQSGLYVNITIPVFKVISILLSHVRKQSVSLSDHCDLKSRPDSVLVPTLSLSRPFMFFVHNGVRSGVFVEP